MTVQVARWWTVGVAVTVLGVVATGCGSDGSTPAASSSSSSTPSTTRVPPVAGEQTDGTNATSQWKALAPNAFAEGPDAVAQDLAALRRGGPTSEVGEVTVLDVRRGEPLVVVLRESGVPDDAVVAIETEITLEGGDEGWVVSTALSRRTCARGVSPTDARLCA
jgi:hypothetical protein